MLNVNKKIIEKHIIDAIEDSDFLIDKEFHSFMKKSFLEIEVMIRKFCESKFLNYNSTDLFIKSSKFCIENLEKINNFCFENENSLEKVLIIKNNAGIDENKFVYVKKPNKF